MVFGPSNSQVLRTPSTSGVCNGGSGLPLGSVFVVQNKLCLKNCSCNPFETPLAEFGRSKPDTKRLGVAGCRLESVLISFPQNQSMHEGHCLN